MKKFLFLSVIAFLIGVAAFFATEAFKNRPTLAKIVQKSMASATGEYGIVIKHLKTGETYTVKEHKVFDAASLYKLWVMAEAFSQMKDGELLENDVLSQDIPKLNAAFGIDEEAAELKEGHIEMTVLQALEQMITISHNYAALLLSERVKNSEILKFLKTQELRESTLSGLDDMPKTTASDIALFYEKLYKGEIVDKQASQKMLELLKQQKRNDGIPKYLPKNNVSVAHKTGEIGWFKHNGGIVFTKKGDYIIVVLSESDSPLSAEESIAKLSEAVYSYFNRDDLL